jgi:hypothetical protein
VVQRYDEETNEYYDENVAKIYLNGRVEFYDGTIVSQEG